jgi:hypothetical protein
MMKPLAGEGAKGADGRRGPRTPVDLEAVVAGRVPRPARVADLSLLGCLIRTETPLARGAVVDLTLALPDGPLRAKGRVVEASLDGASTPGRPGHLSGLEFLTLAADSESRLRAFLEAEAKRRRSAHTPPA